MARGFGGGGPVGRSSKVNVLVIAGVAVALVCVVAAAVLLSNKPTTAATQTVVVERELPVKMIDVLVPSQDIVMGTALEPTMFKREQRPQIAVDPRSVRDFEEIKGHFARSLVVAGQPLHRDMITAVRPANAITANIPDGFRAVTIRVDVRTSVEGFVQAGAKVDVNWSSTIKGRPAIKVIVQNAKVLSAERRTDVAAPNGAPVPSTVTLLVSDKDAGKIQLASTTGTLSLSLRGDTDPGKSVMTDNVTIDDLLNGDDVPNEERTEGSVMIGGQKYKVLPGGKMVPAS
ncbi:MAG: Flp pilus assembly protein CpaB [Oligoflexia bacterium]|nr:Flp pilus assembly protein CpaB [Oligoflexia bacterium]